MTKYRNAEALGRPNYKPSFAIRDADRHKKWDTQLQSEKGRDEVNLSSNVLIANNDLVPLGKRSQQSQESTKANP